MRELTRFYIELRCMLGLHFWEHGEHRRSGNPARKCDKCPFAQESFPGWVRCYHNDVIKEN